MIWLFPLCPMDRGKLDRAISEHNTSATRAMQFVVEQSFVHRYSFQRNILVTGIAGVLRALGAIRACLARQLRIVKDNSRREIHQYLRPSMPHPGNRNHIGRMCSHLSRDYRPAAGPYRPGASYALHEGAAELRGNWHYRGVEQKLVRVWRSGQNGHRNRAAKGRGSISGCERHSSPEH